ncbi:MAG: hypothetical protein JXN62_02740 [Bacteroidales bacterium]|nr:hypothetical protein [Bacteroidales bacterium]
MIRYSLILFFLYIFKPAPGQDSLRFSGQLSLWGNASSGSDLPVWTGIRYIPQVNYEATPASRFRLDGELSANFFASAGFNLFDTLTASGNLKLYRTWIRLSSDQMELRLGLQKLNFGSASMLRPLMWFDQIDPRDPLQLTDGVWGLLARYYFLNNTNIWLWGLYGNNERRGWELIPVNSKIPEFGGRLQLPVSTGELAFSYHHRVADSRDFGVYITEYEKIPENRFGLDAKMDFITGLWFEGSFTHKGKNLGMLTNHLVMNAGADYTFAAGNGLYLAFEQLLSTFDEKPFTFTSKTWFSLITLSYPLGLFDKLSTIIYYNWSDNAVYSFLNWQRQYDRVMFYVMAYWNPESFQLPTKVDAQNMFAGKGIQIMFVFNH